MLVETFGLTTDVGSVRDAKGKILTHFEDSPESRMKLLVKKMRVSRAKKPDSIETAPIVEAGKTVKDPKDDQESLLRDVEDIFRTKPFEEDSRHLGNSIESDEEVIEEIDRLLGDEDLVSFHEGIIKKKGRKLWGYMANGMIHLSQGANKKVLRHEVFHLIFWSLDAKTREKILKEAKAMFKIGEDELSSQMKMSGVELDEAREILLEERLADMYEDVSVKYYRRPSFIPESVWTFFENLITTIRSMLGNKRA